MQEAARFGERVNALAGSASVELVSDRAWVLVASAAGGRAGALSWRAFGSSDGSAVLAV